MPNRRIEDVIVGLLKGDAQKNALDFIAHLRANEIKPEESENYWEIKYKDECVCFMWIDGSGVAPGPWTLWSAKEPGSWATWPGADNRNEHENLLVDEPTKKIAWANVNFCASCGDVCGPGKRKTILGKAFDNVCSSAIAFSNPNTEALACVKKMIVIRKGGILKQLVCEISIAHGVYIRKMPLGLKYSLQSASTDKLNKSAPQEQVPLLQSQEEHFVF